MKFYILELEVIWKTESKMLNFKSNSPIATPEHPQLYQLRQMVALSFAIFSKEVVVIVTRSSSLLRIISTIKYPFYNPN